MLILCVSITHEFSYFVSSGSNSPSPRHVSRSLSDAPLLGRSGEPPQMATIPNRQIRRPAGGGGEATGRALREMAVSARWFSDGPPPLRVAARRTPQTHTTSHSHTHTAFTLHLLLKQTDTGQRPRQDLSERERESERERNAQRDWRERSIRQRTKQSSIRRQSTYNKERGRGGGGLSRNNNSIRSTDRELADETVFC